MQCMRIWDLISWRRFPIGIARWEPLGPESSYIVWGSGSLFPGDCPWNKIWYCHTLYENQGPSFMATIPMAPKWGPLFSYIVWGSGTLYPVGTLYTGDAPNGPEIRFGILIHCMRIWDLPSWRRSRWPWDKVWHSHTLHKDVGPYIVITSSHIL